MKIEKGKRVRLKAVLKVTDGDVIEKNIVEYFQGAGTMLPGLETVLEGLEAGASKSGTLDAEHAFGNPAMQASKTISRSEFPDGAEFEVGARFMAKGADGKTDVVLRVDEVTAADIKCSLLHPLADESIEYEVEVLSVTDPTPPPMPADAIDSGDE